jgi:hypothetical protein
MMPIFETSIKKGKTSQVGNYELTPVTNVLKVQAPGLPIGFIWNRPMAVIVRTADGMEKTLPVTDYTRVTIWAMLAGGIAGAIMMGLLYRSR